MACEGSGQGCYPCWEEKRVVEPLDLRSYYEVEEEVGYRVGEDDAPRFRACLRLLGRDFGSLLDVGCAEGRWLEYVSRRVPDARYVGVEVAANRAAKAQARLPHLDIRQGCAELLPFGDGEFDVVTCMEVLEHVPDWAAVFQELLRVAGKEVLVTVPYREKIVHEICIHCHKPTPQAGHLHRFDESSFSRVVGARRVRYKRIIRPGADWLHRVYYRCFRNYRWLAVLLEKG